MQINNWNDAQAERAESTWGQTVPVYSKEMFDFIIQGGNTYLDLGCGFGRFLTYLKSKKDEPDYVGYDSSEAMIERIRSNHPEYFQSVFHKNITAPISHKQESILVSAVLIHLTIPDQQRILSNIRSISPRSFCFDINSPSEQWLQKADHFEKIIQGGFRMTWQSHYVMTKQVMVLFHDYDLSMSFYPVHRVRHKVVYKLTKRS